MKRKLGNINVDKLMDDRIWEEDMGGEKLQI